MTRHGEDLARERHPGAGGAPVRDEHASSRPAPAADDDPSRDADARRALEATGADAAVLLDPLPDAQGLRVAAMAGEAMAAQRLADASARRGLQRAFRSGEPSELRSPSGDIIGLAQPVLCDGHPSGLLALVYLAPRLAVPELDALAVRLVAGEISLALAQREAERDAARRRAFALQDQLVQQLVVARYAMEMGRVEDGLAALGAALEEARRLVMSELGEAVEPGSLAQPLPLAEEETRR